MTTGVAARRLELPVQGMTCASCASRIERKLNKLDGVHATVNYATEKAAVEFDPEQVTPDELVAAVQWTSPGSVDTVSLGGLGGC